jgi:FKBP-type peptidyl-prolyl cis-trans isomerase FkpA
MKRAILILSVSGLLFSGIGCIKNGDCQDKTIQSEQAAILAYASANSIAGTAHSSGIYYQIISTGSGPTPSLTSQVSVRYTGKLLDGTVFDSQTGTPVSFQLGATIPGWQIALQQIQKGGQIKVIIPSALAYKCGGYGSIPGNSILYFDIQLVDVL